MAEAISEQADQTGDETGPVSGSDDRATPQGDATAVGAERIVGQRSAPECDVEGDEDPSPSTSEEEDAATTPVAEQVTQEKQHKGQLIVQWAQTLMAGVAALAAIGALIYTAQTTRATVETVELTAKGQITERYTAAVDQLGDDELAVRLGGIYALERIAQESPADQSMIMEVIAGFLREHSPAQRRTTKPPRLPVAQSRSDVPFVKDPVKADVQAAATVLGRRDTRHDQPRFRLDLTNVNLRGANLEKANFANAQIYGADFTGARLSEASFRRSVLQPGEVELLEDHGPQGTVNFSGAVLEHADFRDALLEGAVFTGAWMTDVQMQKAYVNRSDFRGANIASGKFERADLTGSDVTDGRLNGADFTLADLAGATVAGAETGELNFRSAFTGPKEHEEGEYDRRGMDAYELLRP
ncbi:pentapeptide repeat-containing protein [Streptomyces sp. NPDC015661]|uniref:pentapeptide repeat-containing protein n=1 Tax=Streptomyces sp. NPDC015661 TaxID=3364961 RepID=UPI0036F4E928